MTHNPDNPCGQERARFEAEATDPWQITPALKRQWREFPEFMQRWRAHYFGAQAEEESEA